jgi:glucose-6-phosphate 1-epimerase
MEAITMTQFGQLPAVLLRAPDGAEATVTLFGAHLVSWKDAGGRARLFCSARSALDGSRAIRGGVPVIFPQFGERGDGMRHGFARVSNWRLAASGVKDGAAFARFALAPSDLAPQLAAAWPHTFALELFVSVRGGELELTLDVRNKGADAFAFAAALHTYHLVDDVAQVRIGGVEKEMLAIDGKLDKVYEDVGPTISLESGADWLILEQEGFTDAVVWNPGAEDAAALSDLEDEEYRRFVCIEPALLGPLTLEPGAKWRGEYQIS